MYESNENGIVVSTRVPINQFNYTVGQSIDIFGIVDMKLANSLRRLQAGIATNVDEIEEVSINLKVDLQDDSFLKNEAVVGNSALVAGNMDSFTKLLIMVFVSVYSMW